MLRDSINFDRSNHPPDGPRVARLGEVLTVLVVLVIVLLSLAPYDFLSRPGLRQGQRFFITEVSQTTLPDTVANIALYVPLGILLTTVFGRRFGHLIPGVLVTLLCAAALSACLELLQAYSPSRVSSLIDLTANIAGAAVGAAIASASSALAPNLLGALLYEIRHHSAATATRAYCGLLVIFAIMPFTFSFDVQRLAEVYKKSTFIPFATPPEQLEAQGATGGAEGDLGQWMRMRRGARWAAEATSFAALALMIHSLFRREYGFARRAATGLAWWVCGLLALLLSVLQLPVATRAIDVTDILFRLLGVGFGLLLSFPLPKSLSREQVWHGLPARGNTGKMPTPQNPGICTKDQNRDDRLAGPIFTPRLLHVASALAAIYIVYTGVIPLTFDFEPGALHRAISSAAFMPFTAYSSARHDAVFSDLSDKVAAYAVLAGLLAALPSGVSHRTAGWVPWRVLLVCVGLSSIIEVLQAFIPVRVPSLTDPILAGVGCVLGVGVQRAVASVVRFANTYEMAGPEGLFGTPSRTSPSLTDQLVATLAEPNPEAPIEASSIHDPRTLHQ